jgi:hypothetical protein
MFLFGGSNSLLRGGWSEDLIAAAGGGFEVINRSIGAASSLMGVFRAEISADMQPGDVAVWEYGINDFNHFRSGVPVAILIENLGWFLQSCRNRGVHVVPLLMQSRRQMGMQQADPYLTAARDLFHRLSLPFHDCQPATQQDIAASGDIKAVYRDGQHYATGRPLLAGFAQAVIARARAPGMQGRAAPLAVPELAGRCLKIVTEFPGAETLAYGNSIISGAYCPIGQTLTLTEGGALKALIVRASARGGAVTLKHAHRTIGSFSLRPQAQQTVLRWQIKHLLIDSSLFPGSVRLAGQLTADRPPPGTRVTAQQTFARKTAAVPEGDGIIAVVLEQGRQPVRRGLGGMARLRRFLTTLLPLQGLARVRRLFGREPAAAPPGGTRKRCRT